MESITQIIQALPHGAPPTAKEALRIPDIVRVILLNMGQDWPTLYRAIRLNKMWHEHGIDLLWECPPASALEHIVTKFPERKNYYANKIVHFVVDEEAGPHLHPLFSGLGDAFIRLKSIKIEPYYSDEGSGDRSDIVQYIQPTLEKMHIYGADLPDNFFSLLARTCKLRELLLEALEDVGFPTPEALGTLIASTPSVERYIFAAGMEEYLTEMVWPSLARHQNVQGIRMCGVVNNDLLNAIAQSAEDTGVVPFSSLKEFDGQVHCTAIPRLIEMMPHLVKLELEIHGDEMSVIPHLPQLTHLRSLLVRHEDIGIRPHEVEGLNKLACLEELTLSSDRWNTDPECRELNDESFKKLLAKLPELRVLDLYFDGLAACEALETVSKYCPKMEVLKLPGLQHMVRPDFPNRPGVMFPELKVLRVGGFASTEEKKKVPARATIRGLYTHLPKIELIQVYVGIDLFNFVSRWLPTDEEAPYSSRSPRERRASMS